MSETYFKAAVRAELPQLKGYTEQQAYAYFKSILGAPDEFQDYGGGDVYFHYDPDKHLTVPVVSHDGKWGVESVIQHVPEYDANPVEVAVGDMAVAAQRLSLQFGVDPKTVKLHVYSHYTGTDEPVFFDEKKVDFHACCANAKYLNCVCAYAFRCGIHGDTHIGTHD